MNISFDDQLLATTSFRFDDEVINKNSTKPLLYCIIYFYRLLCGSLKLGNFNVMYFKMYTEFHQEYFYCV